MCPTINAEMNAAALDISPRISEKFDGANFDQSGIFLSSIKISSTLTNSLQYEIVHTLSQNTGCLYYVSVSSRSNLAKAVIEKLQ